MRFFALISFLWLVSSCGGSPAIVEKNCDTTSPCFFYAPSGRAETTVNGIESNRDYYIWILSNQAVTQKNKAKKSVTVSSNIASALLSQNEEQIRNDLKARNGISTGTPPNLQNIIGAPNPQFFNSVGTVGLQNLAPLDLYIPEPRDYFTKLVPMSEQEVPITLPIPSDITRSGRRASFDAIEPAAADYQYFVDASIFTSATQFMNEQGAYLHNLSQCLDKVLSKEMNSIGRPLFRFNTNRKLNILFTSFSSAGESQTAGLFSQRDRFSKNGDKPMNDGNRGEFIYLRPSSDISFDCATVAHEYQHFMNFEYKTLDVLSPGDREDFSIMLHVDAPVQKLSFNEGSAHTMELLTGERTFIPSYIKMLLLSPIETTLSLDLSFNDSIQNRKTRALATLLYLFGLRRAGGTLSLDNSVTQNFMKSMAESKRLGVSVFSEFFHEDDVDYLRQFGERFTKSLVSGSLAAQFLPPRELTQTTNRGFEILPLSSSYLTSSLSDTSIHPLEIDIPPLASYQNHYVFPQSLLLYRLRTSMNSAHDLRLTINSSDNPLYVGVFAGETAP